MYYAAAYNELLLCIESFLRHSQFPLEQILYIIMKKSEVIHTMAHFSVAVVEISSLALSHRHCHFIILPVERSPLLLSWFRTLASNTVTTRSVSRNERVFNWTSQSSFLVFCPHSLNLPIHPPATHIQEPGVWHWPGHASGSGGAQRSREVYTPQTPDGRGRWCHFSQLFVLPSRKDSMAYTVKPLFLSSCSPLTAWSGNILTWRLADITR